MRHLLVSAAVVLAVILGGSVCGQNAERRHEPLVDQVRKAITGGVRYLREMQRPNGSWELTEYSFSIVHNGGATSLAVLALLNSGLSPNDPLITRALTYLRGTKTNSTYACALQTMALVEAGFSEDRERIAQNVKWLIDIRQLDREGKLTGWSYGRRESTQPDNSNTQYALLGLHYGKLGGAHIPDAVWSSIRDYYTRMQKNGGWTYSTRGDPFTRGGGPSLTMTTAGLCGLLIAGAELNESREEYNVATGAAANCGVYREGSSADKANKAAAAALEWIGSHFQCQLNHDTFYSLYSLERAGRLSGLRFFGSHDWYREGCAFLVKAQAEDGSWASTGHGENWPVVSTSFSLLFLSKGRTPVLISKLVHGPWPRMREEHDWNNDRNDVRHLTEYASRALFKRLPLAWQAVDVMRAAHGSADEDSLREATADLLQTPIVYFNGHRSPARRFTSLEKEVLRRYIDNGGFIFAEACCGSKEFQDGFEELVQELWPDGDHKLEDLDANHPIWSAHFLVKGSRFKLKGIQMGCKTVLVYSPQDLSCLWESNKGDDEKAYEGLAVQAFHLGTNIVAYATGMEPPRPRLTEVPLQVVKEREVIPRGALRAGQLKHGGDWHPAPRAMTSLMTHVSKLAGVEVAVKTADMDITNPSLVDFKFLYMHGRNDFHFEPRELEKLRFNLETGGLLFADACCGKERFDAAFRAFVKELFPKEKLVPIPAGDELFGKELNGQALTEETIRCRRERGAEFRPSAPALEGIKINDRWVVIYSKYDIGCALERHQSSDCLGYDHDSALKIGSAAVLYSLRP
jgi:Domain of unknown function (DUF4159)